MLVVRHQQCGSAVVTWWVQAPVGVEHGRFRIRRLGANVQDRA